MSISNHVEIRDFCGCFVQNRICSRKTGKQLRLKYLHRLLTGSVRSRIVDEASEKKLKNAGFDRLRRWRVAGKSRAVWYWSDYRRLLERAHQNSEVDWAPGQQRRRISGAAGGFAEGRCNERS